MTDDFEVFFEFFAGGVEVDVEDDDGFFVGVGVDGVVGGGVMRKRFGIFVIFE